MADTSPPSPPDTPVLARWQQELSDLQNQRTREPDSPSAWWVEMRIDIFKFLINRYAGGAIDVPALPRSDLPQTSNAACSTSPQSSPPVTAGTPSDWARPPAPKAAVQSRLGRIANHNAARHLRYQAEREEQMRERAEAEWEYFLQHNPLGKCLHLIMERETDEGTVDVLSKEEFQSMILGDLEEISPSPHPESPPPSDESLD